MPTPPEVDTYLAFLLRHGQTVAGDRDYDRLAAEIATNQPDGRSGQICGIPKLTGPVPGCG